MTVADATGVKDTLRGFIQRSTQGATGKIVMDDLDIENFKSLNATAAFVMRKNGGA